MSAINIFRKKTNKFNDLVHIFSCIDKMYKKDKKRFRTEISMAIREINKKLIETYVYYNEDTNTSQFDGIDERSHLNNI